MNNQNKVHLCLNFEFSRGLNSPFFFRMSLSIYLDQDNKYPLRPQVCGKFSSFMLDMPKMRNLRDIHVPGVQLTRNLAETFIKTIEAQKDLKFVDSLVPTYKNLSRKMRFSGSYLTTFLLVIVYVNIFIWSHMESRKSVFSLISSLFDRF